MNQTSFLDGNQYPLNDRKFSRLEPRRSNPLDQYHSSPYLYINHRIIFILACCWFFYRSQWQISHSQGESINYHPVDNREDISDKQQQDSYVDEEEED